METEEARLHNPLLVELLNPQCIHGKKSTFLQYFIELLDDQGLSSFNCDNVDVVCEKWIGIIDEDTSEGGRIDVFIDVFIDDHKQQIIIENKIYAEDQPLQLLRYRNAYPHATILYLTLYGDDPSNVSTGNKEINYHTVSGCEMSFPVIQLSYSGA